MIRNIYITFFAIQALLMLALAVAGGASSLLLGLLVTAIVFQIKMPEKYKLILGLYLAYNTLLIALFYLFYMFWRKWFLFMLPAVNYILIFFYFRYYYNKFKINKNNIMMNDIVMCEKDEVAPNNKV